MTQTPFGAMLIDSGGNILSYYAIDGIEPDEILGRNLFAIALALGLENPLDGPFNFEEFLMEGKQHVFMLNGGVMLTLLRVERETFALCKNMAIAGDEKATEPTFYIRGDKLIIRERE